MYSAASALVAIAIAGAVAHAAPMRPLPQPSKRPAASGRVLHVAPNGDDANDGSAARPWQTIGHGAKRLRPGDTLYVHGGVYFEGVELKLQGTPAAPITIRSAPGELAVIDGGIREFVDTPAKAWEPVGNGGYRSTATYAIGTPFVAGNFVDTMVPLHSYKFAADLRATTEYWTMADKADGAIGVYLGPGLWFDPATKRIHARLAPTTLTHLPRYAGETDPRKVPISVGDEQSALRIERSQHVRVQDLVVRGSAIATVLVADSRHVELDGLTVYGGSPAMAVRSTTNFKLLHSALRGRAAPWSSRSSMKYRSDSSYLFVALSAAPQNTQWELAHNEFTDNHDGVVIDSVKTLRFHHNLLDNFNDDALYLTLVPRDTLPDDVWIHENLVTRAYTALAFGDRGAKQPNPIGTGYYIFRNVFDLRDGTAFAVPADAAGVRAFKLSPGTMCIDHGSPTWDPMFFYNNTVITAKPSWRDYYGAQLIIKAKRSRRRVFNNVFVHLGGVPGVNLVGIDRDDVEVDGNLFWSDQRMTSEGFFARHRGPRKPGWTANDVYGDPRFAGARDARITAGSAATDAGIDIPKAWPDTLRAADKGKPDIGALPLGAPALRVGP